MKEEDRTEKELKKNSDRHVQHSLAARAASLAVFSSQNNLFSP
jgi:hypothetical protein